MASARKTRPAKRSRTPKPTSVILTGMAGIGDETLRAMQTWLGAGADAQAVRISADPDMAAALSAVPDSAARAVIFYTRCRPALARALSDGQMPDAALTAWQTAATALLEAARHHRAVALLVDADAAAQAPEAARAAVAGHLGLPPWADADAAPPQIAATDPVHQVFAAHLLASSREVRLLDAELEASAPPLEGAVDAGGPDLEQACRDYALAQAAIRQSGDLARAEQDIARLEAALARAEQDTVRLQAQLAETQALLQADRSDPKVPELEAALARAAEDSARLTARLDATRARAAQDSARLTAELDAARADPKVPKLEAALARAAEQKDILLSQMQQVQQELQFYFRQAEEATGPAAEALRQAAAEAESRLRDSDAELARTRQEKAETESRLHEKQDEIARFLASRSWKITGPMRWVKTVLSRPNRDNA